MYIDKVDSLGNCILTSVEYSIRKKIVGQLFHQNYVKCEIHI